MFDLVFCCGIVVNRSGSMCLCVKMMCDGI